MSLRIDDFVVLGVMSILVALFAWIYVRDRQPKSAWWLLGWVAIFFHFAAFPFADGTFAGWRDFGRVINRSMLIIAGMFFLLSVSELKTRNLKSSLGAILYAVIAIAYTVGTVFTFRPPWLFVSLLAASGVVAVADIIRIYGLRNWFWPLTLTALLPYYGFAISQAARGNSRYGLDFYLCSLFVVTAMLYVRHFRRVTPGVLFTCLAFLAWGCVFPVATITLHHRIGITAVLWDLPKYSVAFGMLLTLFENQAAAASSAARQFKELFESNLAAVYLSTFEGKLLDCNAAYLQMYGFKSKQQALDDSHISHCIDPAERIEFIEALKRDGHVLNYECRHHRKDGTPFWILERATIVNDSLGRLLIEGTSIDITERKHAELALKQSEERFATLFRQSPLACVLVSLDGVLLDANDNFLKLLGKNADEALGKSSVELGFFPSRKERQQFFDKLRARGSVENLEVSFKDSSGHLHQGLYFANFVWVGDRECICGMMLDQTEQHELKRKFLQAQKMEALGRLAGGVAHDFNNLLGVIGGYAELLEAKLGSQQDYARYCEKILDTTERASGLTRQLLTFSRKEVVRPMPLRPSDAVRALESFLSRLLGEDIEVLLDLRAAGTVVIDKTHFEQIILNIVVNSRDAMPAGGQIHIQTADISTPLLTPDGTVDVRSRVAISISDSGFGMDEQTRLHAFEPFYTTKEVGRGTGLGLATVYGIVQQCHGEITIDSRPGHGTRINILLPTVTQLEVNATQPATSAVRAGAGSILLVEDEEDLRNATAEFLTSIGYSVHCAKSGPEALRIADANGKIDLVITDVVMPRMNGREFADELLKHRPGTRVLFVSGYADDIVLQTGILLDEVSFLQKPYSFKVLAGAVSQLLSVPMPNAQ